MTFPPYVTTDLIAERLPIIFPEGTPNRNYCIRDTAVRAIFTFIYIGAIEYNDIYLGPVHVYRMTNELSAVADEDMRFAYGQKKLKPEGKRWYEDNSREAVRDETLREGLIQVGVVTSLNLATTSSLPRYQLKKDFADLFKPDLLGDELQERIFQWQNNNLTSTALNRLKLVRHANTGGLKVLITLPNGLTRLLSPGPSTEISKAVIEVFAPTFLENPVLLWLSTSDEKVVNDELAKSIGLNIEADKNLPDIILVDIGPKEPLLVFIEVVATDGPISERRKQAIYALTDTGGFDRSHITFVTAYLDRESAGYKKTTSALAWNSFAWFVSEPDNIVILRSGATFLSKIINIKP